MFKIIKESYQHTNKYIVLATPLILFSLISSLYLLFSLSGNLISHVCAMILFVLMLSAFLAGWFYIIALSLKNDDIENPNRLLKDFVSGVGEYFLQTIVLIILTFTTILGFTLVAYLVGTKLIGNIGINTAAFSKALISVDSTKAFLETLSQEQLVKLSYWNLVMFIGMTISYFVIMFYSPSMFFKNKNPLKAILTAIRDLFSRKFFKNILLFIFIFIIYAIISVLSAIFANNIIMHFVFTLINFYYLVFATVCVFNYYYSNFVKIGSNIDTQV